MECGGVAISAWPPSWARSRNTSNDSANEHGTLTWVEPMPHGIGLWLTRRFDGVAQRGSLLWSGPPSVEQLEDVLRPQIGQVFREIGNVEIVLEPRAAATLAGALRRR